MKPLKFALILTALLTTPVAFAGNCDGGSCTGGGNVLKDFLISDYAVKSTNELPHFSAADQYIKMMEERVPDFGAKLRSFTTSNAEDPNGVQWYLIPSEIKELPSAVTHLNFPTDQSMYQVGKEVFVSEPDTSARKPELMGRVYLQDLLELAHPTKDPESVRKLLVFLKTNNYAPPQATLANMLQQLGFGKFETKTTLDARAEKLRKKAEDDHKAIVAFHEARVNSFLKSTKAACDYMVPAKYLPLALASIRHDYEMALGVLGFVGMGDNDTRYLPQYKTEYRTYAIDARNQLWDKNDHWASLHAALKLPTVNYDDSKPACDDDGRTCFFPGNPAIMDLWYAGYYGRVNDAGGASGKSTLTKSAKARIAGYEKKYEKLWNSQRVDQVCKDVDAIVAERNRAPDAGTGSASKDAAKDAGETDAQ